MVDGIPRVGQSGGLGGFRGRQLGLNVRGREAWLHYMYVSVVCVLYVVSTRAARGEMVYTAPGYGVGALYISVNERCGDTPMGVYPRGQQVSGYGAVRQPVPWPRWIIV